MKELINELGQQGTNLANVDARIFLEFQYLEIKDLLKHFLSLISASLVFSVTFAEKIVNFENATKLPKCLLISSWGTLIVALGCCGVSLYTLYLSAERALLQISGQEYLKFSPIYEISCIFQDLAGLLFGTVCAF